MRILPIKKLDSGAGRYGSEVPHTQKAINRTWGASCEHCVNVGQASFKSFIDQGVQTENPCGMASDESLKRLERETIPRQAMKETASCSSKTKSAEKRKASSERT